MLQAKTDKKAARWKTKYKQNKNTNKRRKQANIKTRQQACKLGNRHQNKQTNKQAK